MVWDDVIEGRLPMPKIFVVSLHRSATQSTGRFLREAGFTVCDWLGSVGGVDYQSQAIGHEIDRRGIVQQLEPPFAQYEAFKDVPLPVLYRELEAVYPDALCRGAARPGRLGALGAGALRRAPARSV
jgi:Sulfotransferase domain